MMFKLGPQRLDSARGLTRRRESDTREETMAWAEGTPCTKPMVGESTMHWGTERREWSSARTQRSKQQKLTLVKVKPNGKLSERYWEVLSFICRSRKQNKSTQPEPVTKMKCEQCGRDTDGSTALTMGLTVSIFHTPARGFWHCLWHPHHLWLRNRHMSLQPTWWFFSAVLPPPLITTTSQAPLIGWPCCHSLCSWEGLHLAFSGSRARCRQLLKI